MGKKRTFKEFKQGIFTPKNKAKCLNKTLPVFRSGLESQLMVVLDSNNNVKNWGSETIVVPYLKPTTNKVHRYFIDFYAEIMIEGVVKKFIIEIKPHKETIPIVESNRMKPSTIIYAKTTFAINQAKWKAATEYANKKGWTFLIITEKNIDKIIGK